MRPLLLLKSLLTTRNWRMMFISVLQIIQLLFILPAETKEVVAFLGPWDGSAGLSEIIRFTNSGKTFSLWFNWNTILIDGTGPILCNISLPSYPQGTGTVYGYSGGVVGSTIIICGGSDHQNKVSDKCYALTGNLQQWVPSPPLKM